MIVSPHLTLVMHTLNSGRSRICRLKEIQCYRGRRHIANLPVRGQGTKNNARTRKGKKQMAIAGKK